ncbi:MAG: porin [Alphaproteobacteria bacterium]|nr:porin [Alphaproteobacteria bacterium]
MNRTILNTGLCLGLVLSLNSQVFANAAPAAGNCCDDHNTRLKKLEDRAVMSTANKVTLSGLVNRAMMWMDNGKDANLTHIDNGGLASRFNLTGTGVLTEDITVNAIFEVGMHPNSTSTSNSSTGLSAVDVNSSATSAASQQNILIRKAEAGFTSKKFGGLLMGRGWMASSGGYETDISGTSAAAAGVAAAGFNGFGLNFLNSATKAKSGTTVLAIFNPQDLTRKDRVRYDSPKFYGFSAHASHAHQGTGDISDVALRYDGAIGATKLKGLATWAKDNSAAAPTPKAKIWSVNASALFPVSFTKQEGTGLNLNVVYVNKKNENVKPKGNIWFGKLGLIERLVSVGNTALAVDYGRYKNLTATLVTATTKPTGKTWGLTLSQRLDPVASEVYAAYRNYDYKLNGSTTRFKKINTVLLGAVVKM